MPATYLLFRNYSCKIGHLLLLQLYWHNRRRPKLCTATYSCKLYKLIKAATFEHIRQVCMLSLNRSPIQYTFMEIRNIRDETISSCKLQHDRFNKFYVAEKQDPVKNCSKWLTIKCMLFPTQIAL